MANMMTTASAVKKSGADKSKRGPIRGGSFTRADNGYTLNIEHEPAPGAKDQDRWSPNLTDSTVHESADSMLAHLGDVLAGKGKAKAKAEPTAKSEPGQKQAAPPADEEEDEEE